MTGAGPPGGPGQSLQRFARTPTHIITFRKDRPGSFRARKTEDVH
jgi:hypothetical protein